MPFSWISARVSGWTNAPPPVATTLGPPSSSRAITRRSPSRKCASPNRSKISAMLSCAAFSISSSASRNGRSSNCASLRPIVDLPTPIMPTSTTGRSRRAATLLISLSEGLRVSMVIAASAIDALTARASLGKGLAIGGDAPQQDLAGRGGAVGPVARRGVVRRRPRAAAADRAAGRASRGLPVKRALLLAGAALALTSTLALAAPESLLPGQYDNPAPTPAPRPTPAPASTAGGPAPSAGSTAVIQPLPGAGAGAAAPQAPIALPPNFPSLAELEKMEPDEVDELLGLKPKFDIPPAARRAVRQVGVIDAAEGGFAAGLLDNQPAALVRAALAANRGPLVSRWGHILLRRALASRMDAPNGMDPVLFAALRAALLNRMGEADTARALVQDVDSANYDTALASAAFDAYLATGDLLGMCPVALLKGTLRDDPEWTMTRWICTAYAGNGREAERQLQRMLYYGEAPRIDALLAQRFAGAAGEGRREVNIEWNGVDELTPWRMSLARALGVELPQGLRDAGAARLDFADVMIPATPLQDRIAAADLAGARGVLSSAAMVGLYSQLWAEDIEGDGRTRAAALREAYV